MPVETAFVPNFDYDVFISYAWVDNQVDDDDQSAHGWVSQFRDRLTRRIDQKLGRIDSAWCQVLISRRALAPGCPRLIKAMHAIGGEL